MSFDRIAAAKAHNRLIDDLDREIEWERSAEAAAERAAWAERERRWGNLPSLWTPAGTPTHRMTDEQVFHADRQER